jgi:hypothetical protein
MATHTLYDSTIKLGDLRPDIASVYVHQWQNKNYWLGLTKQARKRQKDKYNKVVSLYSDNIQAKTASLIAAKWSELSMAS